MIKLTLFNNSDIIVNAELIELVEHTPDTLISLTTGKKIMVKESVDDVVRRIVTYRRLIEKKNKILSGRVSRTLRSSASNKSNTWT